MALVRWSPLQELADMRREMQSFASLMSSRLLPFTEDRFVPAMDVTTRGEDLIVKLELPGQSGKRGRGSCYWNRADGEEPGFLGVGCGEGPRKRGFDGR
jgi:hypothetical protein